MRTILASVGRGGINRTDDVRLVQELLNQHIRPPRQPLVINGRAEARMIAAIEAFQRQVVQMQRPDGRVEPGDRTFAALVRQHPASSTRSPED